MGKDFADMICAVIMGYIIAGVIAGVAITLSIMYVVPWLWSFIKPTIHAWTV